MSYEFYKNDVFYGVFAFLHSTLSPTVYKSRVIANASSVHEPNERGDPYVVVDPTITGNTNKDNWHSIVENKPNITFQLVKYKIQPSSYSIRARNDFGEIYPKHWILEASNDMQTWATLHDSQDNNEDINGNNKHHNYQIDLTQSFSIFRITQLACHNSAYGCYFVLNKVEIFGRLFDLLNIKQTCKKMNKIPINTLLYCSIFLYYKN